MKPHTELKSKKRQLPKGMMDMYSPELWEPNTIEVPMYIRVINGERTYNPNNMGDILFCEIPRR